MQIAQVLAGYTLGGADLLRRAMGKKNKAEMDEQRADLHRRRRRRTASRRTRPASDLRSGRQVRRLRLQQEPRRGLRAGRLPDRLAEGERPVEFFAALDDPRHRQHRQAQRLPPGARAARRSSCCRPTSTARRPTSRSRRHAPTARRRSRYALAGASRASAASAMAPLVAVRAEGGPFKDLFDFAERLDPQLLNKRLAGEPGPGGRLRHPEPQPRPDLRRHRGHAAPSQATPRIARQQAGQPVRRRTGRSAAPQLPKVPGLAADRAAAARSSRRSASISRPIRSMPTAQPEAAGRHPRGDMPALLPARRAGPRQARRHGDRPPGAHLGQGQPLRLRAVLRPVGRLRAHRVRRGAGQPARPAGAGQGGAGLRRRAARRGAGQADGPDGREARGGGGQLRRRPAHRDLRSRRARGAAQVARRQARARPGDAGRADGPDEIQVEVTLPGSYSIAGGLRDAIGSLPGIAQVEEIEPPARPVRDAWRAQAPEPAPGEVRPTGTRRCCRRRSCRPKSGSAPRRGSFPGWRGLVYEGVHPQTALSKKGLAAYAQIRCCAPSASTGPSTRRSRRSSTRATQPGAGPISASS